VQSQTQCVIRNFDPTTQTQFLKLQKKKTLL